MRRAFVLALVVGILSSLNQVASTNGYTNVTVGEARTMLVDGLPLVLLDVRNQSEYDLGHLRNALLIPLAELEGRLGELNATDRILVYCALGGRSAVASQMLVDHGFTTVLNMLDGIEGWRDAGYPAYVRYLSLQEAVNSAHAGATLRVSSGRYDENLTITKPLYLVGEDRATTVIDANYTGNVILVLADNTSISSFTLQGSECMCSGPHGGVHIGRATQNISITDNRIIENGDPGTPRRGVGVYADSAHILTIAHNVFGENEVGILLVNTSHATITANTIAHNRDAGIHLEFSEGNLITENTISANTYGIRSIITADTRVVHNSFINNSEHTFSFQSENLWDNGVEGNYWANHSRSDVNADGLADAAYVIDTQNVDRYPLLGVFSGYTLQGASLGVVSNSTINALNYIQANHTIRMRVANTSSDQIAGFCRLSIPHSVVAAPYHVSVDGGSPLLWNFSLLDNGTHRWIYFAYAHSTLEIVIIPEFPPIMMALMMVAALTLAVYRGKRSGSRSAREKPLRHGVK